MLSNKITVADIAKLAGVTRHKVRSMMRDLPGFSDRGGLERVATQYNELDLAVLTVCFELEKNYGLRHDALGFLVEEIRRAFSGPKSLASGAYLLIVVHAKTVTYLDKWSRIDDGLLVPLDALFQRIDTYLGQLRPASGQGFLRLSSVVISGSKKEVKKIIDKHDHLDMPKTGFGS
jgi:hypothetical protein